jgi:4-alpha-glucanotransferase
MKILQFAFGGDGAHEFLPHNYGRPFVVYTGTHDNDTVRGWWLGRPARAPLRRHLPGLRRARRALGHDPRAANSVANLAVFPLQDVLGLDSTHRMNTPGTLGGRNWTWRFTRNWPAAPSST